MILEHYSHEAIDRIKPVWETYRRARHDKPSGLWVSVKGEDDWPSWCRSEEFRLSGLDFCHVVTLSENANILLIASVIALDEFDHDWHVAGSTPWGSGIRWADLAKRYDGIIIAPYQWERRLSDRCGWYYGWDCASGCIWNPAAISSVRIAESVA